MDDKNILKNVNTGLTKEEIDTVNRFTNKIGKRLWQKNCYLIMTRV